MTETFAPRDLTIAHTAVWESLTLWAQLNGLDLTLAIPARTVGSIDCYVVTPKAMPPVDYYRAERDSEGNIRLNSGRGLMVANATQDRRTIQHWRDRATQQRFIAQYDAALALFDREAGQ